MSRRVRLAIVVMAGVLLLALHRNDALACDTLLHCGAAAAISTSTSPRHTVPSFDCCSPLPGTGTERATLAPPDWHTTMGSLPRQRPSAPSRRQSEPVDRQGPRSTPRLYTLHSTLLR